MYRGGAGLLPAELREVIRAPEPAHLKVADRLHPTMQGLSQEGDPLGLGQVPFLQYFSSSLPTTPGRDSEGEDGASADKDGSAAIRESRVIARFDDASENPAIVERPFGQGRVVLIATCADREWHHWPDHPTYLPIMLELSRHVARRGSDSPAVLVGEPLRVPLDPSEFEADATLRTPAYPNESETSLTASTDPETKGLRLEWEHTTASGIYQFMLRRRDGTEWVRPVAVNIDPRESDLRTSSEDELRRALSGVPFEYIVGLDKLTGSPGEPRFELWRLCLFALAATLMTEQILAWTWGRRR
jgi:hypothetical protein